MDILEAIKLLLPPILGAVAAYYFPILIKHLNFTNRKSFTGEWHSTWQTNSESDEQWSIDKVTISYSRGGVFLKNSENNNGYMWEARGEVNKNRFVSGTWRSIKPGSTSAGNFILSVSNQGDFILGFFLGPNRNDLSVTKIS
jgi:hypothetical protein